MADSMIYSTTQDISSTVSNGNSAPWPSTAPSSPDATLSHGAEDFQWVLLLPRLTGLLSLLAVICVSMEAHADRRIHKEQQQTTTSFNTPSGRRSMNAALVTSIQFWYQLPLSCHALAFVLGTTPAPHNEHIWGAYGNLGTCEAQGVVMNIGIYASLMWDAALSAVFLLIVRYKFDTARLVIWARHYHLVVWPITLVLCILPLVWGMFNFNYTVCWLESYPNNCVEDGIECIRGAGASMFQTFASGVAVIHLVYSISVMVMLYCSIRNIEDQVLINRNVGPSSQRNLGPSSQNPNVSSSTLTNNSNSAQARRISRLIGQQGILYASGIVITYVPMVINVLLFNLFGVWNNIYGTFATTMFPLFGFVNFVVFMRKRKLADCQTAYGRCCRRAYTFLFHFPAVTRHCFESHCLPTWTRQSRKRFTEPPISAPFPQQDHQRNRDNDNGDDNDNVEYKVKTRPLKWLDRKHVPDMVSSLGLSSVNGVGGMEEHPLPTPPQECISGDTPPTLPVRAGSTTEVSTDDGDYKEGGRAPVQPVRHGSLVSSILSTISETEVDTEFDNQQTRLSDITPPRMPVRVETELELEETGKELDGGQSFGDISPPRMPVRLETELELDADTEIQDPQHC